MPGLLFSLIQVVLFTAAAESDDNAVVCQLAMMEA